MRRAVLSVSNGLNAESVVAGRPLVSVLSLSPRKPIASGYSLAVAECRCLQGCGCNITFTSVDNFPCGMKNKVIPFPHRRFVCSQFFKPASRPHTIASKLLFFGCAGCFEGLRMSFEISSRVWKFSPHKSCQRIVLLCLADYANTKTGDCFPAQTTLAKRCRIDRRSVQRALQALIKDGAIEQLRLGGIYGGENVSSLYRFKRPYFFSAFDQKYDAYLLSAHWRDLRAKVFSDAGNKCESCGTQSSLHGHHMIYRTPLTECTPEDIMCLCEGCHKMLHENLRIKRSKIPTTRLHTLSFLSTLQENPTHYGNGTLQRKPSLSRAVA